jgi:hypothetical protein
MTKQRKLTRRQREALDRIQVLQAQIAGIKPYGLKEIKGDFSERPLKEIKGVDWSRLKPIKPRYAYVKPKRD